MGYVGSVDEGGWREELGRLGRRLFFFKEVMMIYMYDKMQIFEIIYVRR